MPRNLILKSISGFTFSLLLFSSMQLSSQDTLRTYGPRFGIDIARFAYLLADPAEKGAEASVDLEIYKNVYPVFEAGYNSVSMGEESFKYHAAGTFGRIGIDYNFLPVRDRSIHHSICLGARYGLSRFNHQSENIIVPNSYWGDLILDEYSNSLTGQWLEFTGGIKAELVNNFFMGWTIRYKFLISEGKDEFMSPYLIPGYGKTNSERIFGISYYILYKIPLFKK